MEGAVLCVGVHVLDVLVRPVEAIPEGQNGTLVEQIRLTPAGTAGGTALVLARLGAGVRSAGAIGTDAAGDLLLTLLEREGVDTALLRRRPDVQTSASVLPIRADGSRPALHVVGANATLSPDDVPLDAIASAAALHVGGLEFLGGEAAAVLLRHARAHGVPTSADLLVDGTQAEHVRDWVAPALEHLDLLLPNDDQVRGLTGEAALETGCRALLDAGVGCVAATRGADGALLVDAGASTPVPALPVDVVDTTGCGDAFSAGMLRGLTLGRSRAEAARLGCGVAAQVAGGLGTDAGDYDLASVDALLAP